MFPPDGLLTSEQTKHDVDLDPQVIAPDPFASDDCLNDISPVHQFLLNKRKEETTMNPGTDELSSGLNGRLRPRKSNIPSPLSTKLVRKSEGKTGQDKAKRTSAATKTPPNKTDDLATKSDSTFLCPYCDKKFASKQTLSKHVRRMHGASSKQDSFITCLFCSHYEAEANEIIRHMAETHSLQYFACLNCHTRFSSSCELAEHKIKSCETKLPYRSRLRQKVSTSSMKETNKDDFGNESKVLDGHSFNGVVISCELKPSQVNDGADIEDNITTNLILPPSKSLGSNTVIEKSAVIVLDDIQWNKRIPPNFSFHNTDADQILSRLGVVHRSPRTGEPTKKDWKNLDETTQKFEKCFDTSFYSKVASNVQENLSKFLDGSFNFNPDPDSTIKTRKAKNSVVINTAEGFPILLASEQYSRNAFDRYMPRAIAPKHKWKWDNLESEKSPVNADQIKRDSHTNNCIISLVSSLDIWTQLRMRRKFEEKFGCPPLEKKTEKQTLISNELKDILESRELPTPSSQVVKVTKKSAENTGRSEFPACLGLAPSTSSYELQPAVLSGEWVRPRCYVCCACGAQSQDSRAVSMHVSAHHPNAQVQHYEIVGEQLLNADILKHLYVPPSQMCNRTRPPRGFRECTKCKKSITLDDLHQHMLDCAGDTPAVRRKCRYRPFGVRRRRPRLPDNTIRKKIRKDIRRTRAKALMRPRPIRTEVGDAETIRKMIADLPAKRHRVLVNPTNQSLRPRIKQRPKILMKGRPSEDLTTRIKRNKDSIETRRRQVSPPNDAMSVKSDEDNKPLKPKVRRVANKIPQRNESDKRKTTVLTRAKRPSRQFKEVAKNDNIKDVTNSDSKNVITENMSIENASKKIDINTEDFKAKDHAGQGQGNSNNRGGRPGCSGQNGNSENRCAPAQNVPLKHSIARLTADSEKHDKSVQFHHLFLVQQECNNVNQHVQSGQQLLFENEAAVLTLDKPPLQYNTKGSIDTLQKNKLNKPRKGLNACIAMLKNKLVEPAAETAIPAGHVSVQCGDDEPLYVKPDIALHATGTYGSNIDIMAKSDKVHEYSQNNSVSLETETHRSSNQDKTRINTTVKNKSQSISSSSEEQQYTGAKRESSRRKTQLHEDKTIELPSQPHLPTQGNAPTAVLATVSVSPTVIPTEVKGSFLKDIKKSNVECDKSKRQSKVSDICKDIPQTKLDMVQLTNRQLSLNEPYETSNKQAPEEKQIIQNEVEHTKQSTTIHQTHPNEEKPSMKEQSNVYYLQQQTDYHSDSEYNRKVTVDDFPSPNLTHVPINNRPAHASTHVESIVSIPLDLSGKTSNTNTQQDLLNSQNTYLLGNSYDNYETLDLSNKNQDLVYREETASTLNEEIVDLSIKTSHIKSANVSEKDDVTDLSFKSCASLDVPTDLTVKKKVTSICTKQIVPDVTEIRQSPPKREASNLNKPTSLHIENQITQLSVYLDPSNKDKKASCASENLGTANIVINEITHTDNINENNMPASKLERKLSVTEISTEKIIENIPADLSCQQKADDNLKELSPKGPLSVSFGETDNEDIKNQEKSSQMHPRTCDKTSVQIQKHIYDPTLKIPQYKIRTSSTFDNPSNIDLTANTSSLVNTTSTLTLPLASDFSETDTNFTQVVSASKPERKTCVDVQDQSPFVYGTVPSMKNCGVSSQLSKIESTTPVYSLAKACISVTKIESSSSATLTNTLLSIPGSTIANTTPVYTLAGTTIGVQANYSHFVSALPSNQSNQTIQKNDEEIIPGTSNQNNTQYEKGLDGHKEKVDNANLLSNVEQDPETARKIALLPKELVDVLGNMPVDHRNRLLNILPQYVSTPLPDTGAKPELSNQSQCPVKLTTSSGAKENKISSTAKSKRETESKITSPLFIAQQENELLCLSNTGPTHVETRTGLVHSITLPFNCAKNQDDSVITGESYTIQTHEISKGESQAESIKSDVTAEESLTTVTMNRSLSDVSTDKIIDLTEDETVPRAEIHNEPVVEVPPQVPLLVRPKRNKSNNEQTASLRAVRIKAPSARQRSIDSQLGKYSAMVPILANKIINNDQDNEVEKSLHNTVSLNTDISLAIQQAEVSSTQHSNKNVTAECKFPSVTSPILQESNLDETNSCTSRRLSTSPKDGNTGIDGIQNIKSVVKTTLVTSSVVNNDINKDPSQVITNECSSLNSDLPNTEYICIKRDVSFGDNELTKNSPTTITQSSSATGLDISEPYGLPTQCSTPKPKAVIENATECLPTSPESPSKMTCEDQEDSDDDLSLAVICKQKRQNLLKKDQIEDVNKSKKEAGPAIRKKDKKNKKNVENMNVSHVSSVNDNNTVTAMETEEQISVSSMDNDKQTKMATSDENMKQKNRKSRRINAVNNTQLNPSAVAPKMVLNNVTVDTNKEDEVRVKGDVSFNTILKDDNKQSIGTSRKRSKVNDDIAITENMKEHSFEKSIHDTKSKASPIRQKYNKKKKGAVAQTESINTEKSKPSLDEKSIDSNIIGSNKTNILTDQDPIVQDPTNINELHSEDKATTVIDDCYQLIGSNNTEDVTLPMVVVPLTSCSSIDEASNISTPLRRSKRVRSRNNSVAGEELQVDTLPENRIPLTKKQLIFSKLLLDEENNIKNPEGVSDDIVDHLRKTQVSEIVQTDVIREPVPDENIVKDRSKSIKRKNSVHLKCKSKKKKTFNKQISCEDKTIVSLHDQDSVVGSVVTSQEEQKPSVVHEQPSCDSNICAPSISESARSTVESISIQPNERDLEASVEKRKSGDLPHVELTQSSQPKKIKPNTTEYGSDMRSPAGEDDKKLEKDFFTTKRATSITNVILECNTDSENKVLEEHNIASRTCPDTEKHTGSKINENDLRIKTCYNMPAGRRTRSKSAVIKSAVYDPYDIDLDDMIEHAEPLRQRKIGSEYRSPVNIDKQSSCSKGVTSVAINEKDNKLKSFNVDTPIALTLDSYSNYDNSDSDDSSKSDIPLKKYVEEKEKKFSGLDESVLFSKKNDIENDVDSDLNYNSKHGPICDKKDRRTLGVCNTGDGIAQDETEQQLRSEQFMESFGFFSERKPRKSNLLATKKISETFHIIANESDDMFFGFKERNSKKSAPNENRKSVEGDNNLRGTRQRSPLTRKTVKRGRKKKNSTTVTTPSYCHICKKEFRRSDNFLRHQMTLLHVSKMSEVEMKIKTVPIQEEPNYLIAYKEHLDRLKIITDKMLKRKKNSKSAPKIAPLSLEEILADVNKIVREQQFSHRGLSCDEELFLDCCELLKESHKKQDSVTEIPPLIKDTDNLLCPSQAADVGLDLLGKTDMDSKCDNKNDGDVDSITAKTILESEEVRNLENDLISGLKEAANASNLKKTAIVFQQTEMDTNHQQDFSDHFSSPAATESQYEQISNFEEPVEMNAMKNKKYPEFKEKMYPDIEEIDMFEDKFDKIKRKCRSQAAAAKQPLLVVEPSISRKGRKKSEKKKGKKSSKKNHPSTVLTKGALKGFDGIKVSIPTSDINISAIVSPLESHKKKKKGNRRRRENKNSESSCKYDSDHPLNDSSASLKNVDVYEFMDNEDVELFEFRPSTLMERFKSITNKETPSTSKVNPIVEEAENSSVSASDGDDFVYMSDDYVCSDEETENSLLSCDVSNAKTLSDNKKLSSQMKKRDVVEKNAVMGKIFKNNAVRSEKKITKSKEPAKPKANLDQLFDSLLEDEPSSSMLNDESLPLKDDAPYASKYEIKSSSPNRSEDLLAKYEEYHIKKKYHLTTDKENFSSKYKNLSSDNDDDDDESSFIDCVPSTSKLCLKSFIGDHKSTKTTIRPSLSPPELKPVSPKKHDNTTIKQNLLKKKGPASFVQDDFLDGTEISRNNGMKKCVSKFQVDRSPVRDINDDIGVSSEYNEIDQHFTADETGVARQRARRKCTVGKQNILAETWSSESEPDGGPPRPNSAESMVSGTTRKKKGKKKDGQHAGGRRSQHNRHISFKKQEIVSRVSSSMRNTTAQTNAASSSGVVDNRSTSSTLRSFVSERSEPSTSAASTSGGACKSVEEPPAVPSTSSGVSKMLSPTAGPSTSTGCVGTNPAEPTFLVPAEPGTSGGRHRTYYWSSDGGDEEQMAREALAREELARAEMARAEREQREREQREREEEAQQQQQQQHGWIVGDSHKKLVTMLAHAKGRKRNNNSDDKRHKAE